MTELLRVEGLRKHYRRRDSFLDRLFGASERIKAVDGVDLEIREGETLGLVGESGCGKSTLGRSVLQLETPTAGTVHYDGEDLTTLSKSELREYRSDLQIIFQNPFSSLNPRLTVSDIIGEALDVHGLPSSQTRDERIGELLRTVGLRESHASRYPHEFSGGQRQRISIARALAVEPRFIVCDEPVSGLDVSVQAEILNLLGDLQAEFGISYLFIAHDLSVVNHIADRIAVMYLGKIVEVGSASEIFGSASHPYTDALVSAIPEPDPRWERDRVVLRGSLPSPADPPDGCSFHTRCPEVIPPDDVDLDQGAYREIQTLRQRITERDLPLQQGRTERGASGTGGTDTGADSVVDRIFDDSQLPEEHEQYVEQALMRAIEGDWEEAETLLAEKYASICERVEPTLPSTDNPKSCHLYDQPDRGEGRPRGSQ